MKTFKELFQAASQTDRRTIAVAGAHDRDVILALKEAVIHFHIRAILLGNAEKISRFLGGNGNPDTDFEIIDVPDDLSCIRKAVHLVHCGKADILMKGFMESSIFLKELLDPLIGLRTSGQYIATTAIMETDQRLLFITDPGFTPLPDLQMKKALLMQTADAARRLGIVQPKAAVLSAAEKVNPKMVSSTDAVALKKMYLAGDIPDCIVDGPLSLDIAVSPEAARHKCYKGSIQGDADILLMPSLDAGNILYKSLVHFAHMKTGGIVTGTPVPVVFTSRSDSARTRLNTIAFACVMAQNTP